MKRLLSAAAAFIAVVGFAANAGAGFFNSNGTHQINTYLLNDIHGRLTPVLPLASIDIQRITLQYISPSGKWRLDRMHGDTGFGFMKGELLGSRILFQPSFVPKPFDLVFLADRISQIEVAMPYVDESAYYYYGMNLSYRAPANSITLLCGLSRNAWADASVMNLETIQLSGIVELDAFYLDTALYRSSGEVKHLADTVTIDTTAFLVDVGAAVGKKFDLGVTYLYASGDNPTENADRTYSGLAGLGKSKSFYILTGKTIGTENDFVHNSGPVLGYDGLKAFGVHADYKVNDLLDLYGAIGYAKSADETTGLAGESGWEYNLGAAVTFFNNLTYEAHFGYFAGEDPVEDVEGETSLQANDVYLLSNKLSMTF